MNKKFDTTIGSPMSKVENESEEMWLGGFQRKLFRMEHTQTNVRR